MEFEQLAPILGAVGMAEASGTALDVEQLDTEQAVPLSTVMHRIEQLEAWGLPHTFDDLNTRQAVLHAGTILVDEFRYQLTAGRGADHAREIVPPAFVKSVTDRLALDLFAAAVALMARPSASSPAGCVAEEILAVRLIEEATAWLDMQGDLGELEPGDVNAATDELRSIFELFEDDDVLDLFETTEPADAALWGHSDVSRQLGIVDQRVEAWFRPFGGIPATGHLSEAPTRGADPASEAPARGLTPVVPAHVQIARFDEPGRFRVLIRVWDDEFLERDEFDRMPDSWVYYLDARTADEARARALELFPSGAASGVLFDDEDAVSLERSDLARISIDVQRVGLDQELKPDSHFHIVGVVALRTEHLPGFAAYLRAGFPAAVVASDSARSFVVRLVAEIQGYSPIRGDDLESQS